MKDYDIFKNRNKFSVGDIIKIEGCNTLYEVESIPAIRPRSGRPVTPRLAYGFDDYCSIVIGVYVCDKKTERGIRDYEHWGFVLEKDCELVKGYNEHDKQLSFNFMKKQMRYDQLIRLNH